MKTASYTLAQAFDWLEKDPAHALAIANDALAADQQAVDWLVLKGLALSLTKAPAAAAVVYRSLISLQPDVFEHHQNLGNALLELGHSAEARRTLERAQTLWGSATHPEILYALARAALDGDEPRTAYNEIRAALKHGLSQDLEVGLVYLRVLIAVDEIDLAKDNLQRLLGAQLSAEQASDLALLALQLSEFEAAEAAAHKVAESSENYPLALISMGLAFERSNQMQRLADVRAKLSALSARFATSSQLEGISDIVRNLMQLDARIAVREKRHHDSGNLLRQLLDTSLEAAQRVALSFEYGQVLDAMGDAEGSMASLQSAHELSYARVAAAHPKMAREEDPLYLLDQGIEAPFSWIDDGRLDPIFVVGFPRSGTTLLEQLLDAHPQLASFDEQPFLQKAILKVQAMGLRYPQDLGSLNTEQRSLLRTEYFERCASKAKADSGVAYVDKNPLNLSRLPLIQALFPKAKIIVVIRHPADCVLSCYQQHFRAPAFAVTMRTLASTAHMYDRVFSFYRALKPAIRLPLLEARYEHFVANTEEFSRELFAFLKLPWTNDLLQFTERAKTRSISTPSYAAVTEKVNARAVAKWERYRDAYSKSGALETLRPWIEELGY
jgi:tetratricopeptide (TPR) repeat protein